MGPGFEQRLGGAVSNPAKRSDGFFSCVFMVAIAHSPGGTTDDGHLLTDELVCGSHGCFSIGSSTI